MTTWTTIGAAKLNLTLEVIGKREDGFHNLASVAVSLDLVDDICLTPADGQRSINYRDPAGRPVSIETADDIIARAWSTLEQHCSVPSTGKVEVVKRIPVTSGLGGGSTDAAAFLRLARRAWDLPLSDDELRGVGAEIGSDVPVCLLGGPVRMAGRGERVAQLASPSSSTTEWAVLLHRPEIPVPAAKTATMYRSLRSSDFRRGAATRSLLRTMTNGTTPTQDDCVNSFDRPAREVMLGLASAWRRMATAVAHASLEMGVEPVTPLLAGAGPTLFAILRPDAADLAAERLRDPFGFTYVARPLAREEATAIRAV